MMLKKITGLLSCGLLFSSVFALSCASFPSFEEMVDESNIAFVGTVTNVNFFEDTSEEQYCQDFGSNLNTGTYEYRFDVEDEMKGSMDSTAILQRNVNGINCTRGGACNDMELGKTYVVLTHDGETLSDGLCSPCPYMLVDDYVPSTEPIYDPSMDTTCIVYNDGCNTCNKGTDGLSMCTQMACFTMGDPYCIEYENNGPNPEVCICTMQYDPVCGVDGKTYSNDCVAGCDSIDIAYSGECQFGVPGECQRGYSGSVCGIDNITYDDMCDLEETGIAKQYDGECVPNPGPGGYVEAPGFCETWYDGCNECGIVNGQLTSCTERACFTLNRAKCSSFDFTLLTSNHVWIIDRVVGKRLQTASQAEKNLVIEKVSSKISDINYTLSVSSFAQGSEALWEYQFVLEVLWKIDSML